MDEYAEDGAGLAVLGRVVTVVLLLIPLVGSLAMFAGLVRTLTTGS